MPSQKPLSPVTLISSSAGTPALIAEDFLQVGRKGKTVIDNVAVADGNARNKVNARTRRNSEAAELGANPFHVLAGAFEIEMEDTVSDSEEKTTEVISADQLDVQQHVQHVQHSGNELNTGTEIALENSKRPTEPEGTQDGKTQAERSGSLVQEAQRQKEALMSMLGGQKTGQEQSRRMDEQENEEDGSEEMEKQKLNELSPVTQTDLGQQVNPLEELDLEETTGQNLEQGIDTIAPEAATGQEILNVKENAREVSSAQLAEEDDQTDKWQGWKKCFKESLTFRARKAAVGDSQKKTGTWRRVDTGRNFKEGAEHESGEETGSESGDEGNTVPRSPIKIDRMEVPPDISAEEVFSKGQIRPAEFTDSTPDRGNAAKKRVTHDPKSFHKHLLFSQEISASWMTKEVTAEEPQEQEGQLPDHIVEGELLHLASPIELLPESLEDAIGETCMEA
ncbi:hypothetical protein R1sor_025777 [Riccia sorocarpa]|uniref:Uncharacterized protein n=1 Tax=Riccia sorocarpa TaxID=122646 RepID=A0ABD3GF66_9MARC